MATKLLSVKDLRSKKPAEITKYISELKKERVSLLEQLQTGKTKETHRLKAMKRSIATALTVAKEGAAQAEPKKEEKK